MEITFLFTYPLEGTGLWHSYSRSQLDTLCPLCYSDFPALCVLTAGWFYYVIFYCVFIPITKINNSNNSCIITQCFYYRKKLIKEEQVWGGHHKNVGKCGSWGSKLWSLSAGSLLTWHQRVPSIGESQTLPDFQTSPVIPTQDGSPGTDLSVAPSQLCWGLMSSWL